MKIKVVCQRTGLTARAVRLYCQKGLLHLHVNWQNGRNYLDFSETDILRLQQVATLRRAQFSLDEIERMLSTPADTPAIVTAREMELTRRVRQTQPLLLAMRALRDTQTLAFEDVADALRDAVAQTDNVT